MELHFKGITGRNDTCRLGFVDYGLKGAPGFQKPFIQGMLVDYRAIVLKADHKYHDTGTVHQQYLESYEESLCTLEYTPS